VIQFQPDPPPAGVDPITAEWVRRQLVLLSQSTNAVSEVITTGSDETAAIKAEVDALELNLASHVANVTDAHDIDVKTAAIKAEVDALELSLASHVANVTDAHGIDDKLVWAGRWALGAYKRNDLVNYQHSLFVAKVGTTATPTQAMDWVLPAAPTWASSNVPGPLIVGMRFTSTLKAVLTKLRAWVNTNSMLSIVRDPLGAALRQDFDVTGAGEWVSVDIADKPVYVGEVVDVFLTVPGDATPNTPLDQIVDGWPVGEAKGFRQLGTYDPATVVLTRNQYGVDRLGVLVNADWSLMLWQD